MNGVFQNVDVGSIEIQLARTLHSKKSSLRRDFVGVFFGFFFKYPTIISNPAKQRFIAIDTKPRHICMLVMEVRRIKKEAYSYRLLGE